MNEFKIEERISNKELFKPLVILMENGLKHQIVNISIFLILPTIKL